MPTGGASRKKAQQGADVGLNKDRDCCTRLPCLVPCNIVHDDPVYSLFPADQAAEHVEIGVFMAQSPRNNTQRNLGMGIAIGIAIGAGMGVAFGNIAMGVALGIAFGVIIGLSLGNRDR